MVSTIKASTTIGHVHVRDADAEEIDVTTQRLQLATVLIVLVIIGTNMFITGLEFKPAGSAKSKPES